jgi:hypothetical protein
MKYSLPQNLKFKKIKNVKQYIQDCEYELAEQKILKNMNDWYIKNYSNVEQIRKEIQNAILS